MEIINAPLANKREKMSMMKDPSEDCNRLQDTLDITGLNETSLKDITKIMTINFNMLRAFMKK